MGDEERSEALQDLIRGRLPTDQAAQLEDALQSNAQLAAEHRLVSALNIAEHHSGQFPGELGWARLSRAIAQDGQHSLWRRDVRTWQAAACVLVAVGTWQLAVAPWLASDANDPARFQTATGPANTLDAAATVRIGFAATATAEAIAALLRETNANIVDGPSALGLFTVAFDSDDQRTAALSRFAAEPSVIEVADAGRAQ